MLEPRFIDGRRPGVKQVLLKVQIAEVNRNALRQIGADMLAFPGNNVLAAFANGTVENGRCQ